MTHLLRSSCLAASSVLFLAPFLASAHEHRTFTIGGKHYEVTIGSINEPVYVDDKSGVELMVEETASAPAHEEEHHEDGHDDHEAGTPVTGWEKALKVEVSAGDKKQVFDLRPAYGEPGTYNAVFFPTVETVYTYRLFGTVDGVAFDVSFPCASAEGGTAEDDHESVKISEGVTQTSKSGAFGCPRARTQSEFPEQSDSRTNLTQQVRILQGSSDGIRGTVGLAAGILALCTAIAAWVKAGRRGS